MKVPATIEVLDDIRRERIRQEKKWGKQRHDYPFWLTILTEEVGEVAQAMQQGSVAYKQSDSDDLYEELIQVAAVATAIAEQVKEEREQS
ncbi:MazG-like family protein [Halobacillus shinanisalinarum]|uniref:MazG-like family protein n=1 Tax=Halobacillus shinanisalinarum TaxID=2932258 RepID=A0ABY4GZD5_9BACI|nr:MazG-like family protein [Halobacillus shinanisalinarum]UOQ93391.1 MazG-like family protein [Halobacillus shinanisalinarum]